MKSRRKSTLAERFKDLVAQHPYSVIAVIGTLALFFIDLIISPTNTIYMTIILIIIIAEVIIGSVFLLFNTTVVVLALFLQDGLSAVEKKWIKNRIKDNSIIIIIWIASAAISFLIFGLNIGIIAALYLVALILIFNFAGVEENPFLEQRYEL
ncbi:MAG: hypothetical protein ACXAC8_09535 [Candidatus Hodarchaeales archaeon]